MLTFKKKSKKHYQLLFKYQGEEYVVSEVSAVVDYTNIPQLIKKEVQKDGEKFLVWRCILKICEVLQTGNLNNNVQAQIKFLRENLGLHPNNDRFVEAYFDETKLNY